MKEPPGTMSFSMRLLTRYVLLEVCQVFLITLTTLTVVMVLFGVARETISQGLGLTHVVRLIPYLLPNALLFAVPGTILFAVSIVYGRMSGAGEIIAIKSLGISPMVVLWPILCLSVLLSLLTVWLNDVATSWGYMGVRQVVVNSVEDIAYSMLRTQRSYSTKAFSVNVKAVEDRKLLQPTFSFPATEETPAITITAREAELRSNPGSGVLTIVFRDGSIESGGTSFGFPNDTIQREIALDEAVRKGGKSTSPSHLPLSVFPERIVEQRLTIERAEQALAARAGYALMTGDYQQLVSSDFASAERDLEGHWNQLHRLRTEPPRRWANGFSCLCFALVGAPMAIRRRNADVLSSFFVCFLPILLLYYPLLVYGVDRSKAGAVPPHTVWLANVILGLWGLWLLRKVIRY